MCSSDEECSFEQLIVRCGPIIGKVTSTSAIVLLEVDENTSLVCELHGEDGSVVSIENLMQRNLPHPFFFEGLTPNTTYEVEIQGLAKEILGGLVAKFKTMPVEEEITKLKFIALSCDRFSRLQEDDENPWGRVLNLVENNECDVMLHLGDQVYTCQWGYLTRAYQAMVNHDAQTPAVQNKMKRRAIEYIRDAYRDTWTMPLCRQVMAKTSHLMIWSDNDVANDFTILKDESGEQAYTDEFLTCAMKVYREYQRQLWDPECEGKLPPPFEEIEEYQFHRYGPCGVFLIDMRGNRITANGIQKEGDIMSEKQMEAIREAFNDPTITLMILAAEIPFVGDEPAVIKEKAKSVPFLVDHWPHSEEQLNFLLETAFDWRAAQQGREVLLLGGDIHVGVESTIFDHQTNSSMKCITTSPITNHVCPYFPELEGKVNDRFSFVHKPLLQQRNYCTIQVEFDPTTRAVTSLETELCPVPTAQYLKSKKESECDRKAVAGPTPGHLRATTRKAHDDDDGPGMHALGGTATHLESLLEKGILKVVVHDGYKFPDTGVVCRMVPEVQVSIGSQKASTGPCSEKCNPRNPHWGSRHAMSLRFEESATSIRFKVVDTANSARVGHADFSLIPFFQGWKIYSGNLPLVRHKGRTAGSLKVSIALEG